MRISLNQLSPGENPLEFKGPKNHWVQLFTQRLKEEHQTLHCPPSLDLNIIKVEHDYYMKGTLNGEVKQTCSLCAEDFPFKINHRFEMALFLEKRPEPQTVDSDTEADFIVLDSEELDLLPVTLEQFFLALPYQPICKPDCKGLCQVCGINRNKASCKCEDKWVESPFKVLEKLKK